MSPLLGGRFGFFPTADIRLSPIPLFGSQRLRLLLWFHDISRAVCLGEAGGSISLLAIGESGCTFEGKVALLSGAAPSLLRVAKVRAVDMVRDSSSRKRPRFSLLIPAWPNPELTKVTVACGRLSRSEFVAHGLRGNSETGYFYSEYGGRHYSRDLSAQFESDCAT